MLLVSKDKTYSINCVMKGWYCIENMRCVRLPAQSFAAEQLASVSCFSEAVTMVGVNLLTSLKRQSFCSHFSLPQPDSFFSRLCGQVITFPLTSSLHPIRPQIFTGSASPLSLSHLGTFCWTCMCVPVYSSLKCSFIFAMLLNLQGKNDLERRGLI